MADKSLIVREAQKYLAKGQIDKAIIEWEKLVKEAPDANTYNVIGDLYVKKGNRKAAVENFHKSADLLRKDGFSLKALALFKKIINIDPSDPLAIIALGELSEEKELITDAIKYYLTAADILAKQLNKDDYKERFLKLYERILSLSPGNIPLRQKIAELFMKEGLTADAAGEYCHMARLFERNGDYRQAEQYYRKVIELQPRNKDAYVGLSQIYERGGDPKQALEVLDTALDFYHDDGEVLVKCAVVLKSSGSPEEAIGYLERAVAAGPSDVKAVRMLGDIYLSMGDRQKAWQRYKTVVEGLAAGSKIDDAIALAEQYRDVDPLEVGKVLISLYRSKDDADAVCEEAIGVAEILAEKGQKDEAHGYYEEALKLRPHDVRLKKILAGQEIETESEPSTQSREKSIDDLLGDAEIFIKYGLFDDARAVLEDLKMRAPDNIEVHTRLRAVYVETDDKELAVTECLILAELHGRKDETALKEAALREALRINPDDPRVVERVSSLQGKAVETPPVSQDVGAALEDHADELAEAEFYAKQGLKEDALRVYHKLLKRFPDSEGLRSKIALLESGFTGLPDTAEEREETTIDISQELYDESLLAPGSDGSVTEKSPGSQLDSDVLNIFEEFKRGLERELEAEDSETHYNLGIAYKEMGLVDDAIKEFQTARKDPAYKTRSTSMLGLCFMEKGLYPLAIEAFRGSVANITTRDEAYWGARYDLGCAYEMNGNTKEALDIFSEIFGWNATFRQVGQKVEKLRQSAGAADTAVRQKVKKDRVSYL